MISATMFRDSTKQELTEEQEQLISALEKVRDHWKEYDAKNDSNAR